MADYMVVFEYRSGMIGTAKKVEADTDKQAAERFRYGNPYGRLWVFRLDDASTWRTSITVEPVEPKENE